MVRAELSQLHAFQACPDFKGIKTVSDMMILQSGFKLALISKGLRRKRQQQGLPLIVFQACPDFKGIKTLSLSIMAFWFWVSSLP